jgi:hypothetical protein
VADVGASKHSFFIGTVCGNIFLLYIFFLSYNHTRTGHRMRGRGGDLSQ